LALSFEQKVLLALPPDLPDHTKVEKTWEAVEAYNKALKIYNDYYDALRWTKEDTSLVSKLCKSSGISSKNKQEDKEVEFVPLNRRERRKQEGISQTPIQRFLSVRKSVSETVKIENLSSPLKEEISEVASSFEDEKSFCIKTLDLSTPVEMEKEDQVEITFIPQSDQETFEKNFDDGLSVYSNDLQEYMDTLQEPVERIVMSLKASAQMQLISGSLPLVCAGRKKKKVKKRNGQVNVVAPKTVKFRDVLLPKAVYLRFRVNYQGIISSGGSSYAILWNPNNAYQPLVSGPTGAVPGYAFWTAGYTFLRVIEYGSTDDFMNLGAIPTTCFALNLNNTPGSTPGLGSWSNPLCYHKNVSALGGMDRCRLTYTVKMVDLTGSDACLVADSYRHLSNGPPADLAWNAPGASTIDLSPLVPGVAIERELWMHTIVYDRDTL